MDMNYIILLVFPFTHTAASSSKKKIIIDKEHLRLDFMEIFGSWSTIFTDTEMDFRYFAAHDYDADKHLDGLELLAALGHDSGHLEEHSDQLPPPSPIDIERQVDDLLLEHDSDGDGLLSWREFAAVPRQHLGQMSREI